MEYKKTKAEFIDEYIATNKMYGMSEWQIKNLESDAKHQWLKFKLKKYQVVKLTIFVFVCIFIVLFLSPTYNVTASMSPTLDTGGFCISARYNGMPKLYKVKRGDIVTIKCTESQLKETELEEKSTLCKRVIAIGGEKIQIVNGLVYINGSKKPLTEDYLPDSYVPNGNYGPFYVPDGYLFLMGDNRSFSFDSRFLSEPYFNEEDVVSTVWIELRPNFHLTK